MTQNPFIVSGTIENQLFCDREKETARMVQLLTNGNNVVLKSIRRMGKTGLIEHCFNQPEIKDAYYTFFVDVLHTSCLREFVYALGRSIYTSLVPRKKKMAQLFVQMLRSLNAKFGFDPVSGFPKFNIELGDIERPELTLEEIFAYLEAADKPCLVAIDEFQQVTRYEERNMEALLRSYIQRVRNCHFVFAGSERHLLEQMFEDNARPFYCSADSMSLGAIPFSKYMQFALEQFKAAGKTMDAYAFGSLYRMFEGHTFYVQKSLNEAFAMTKKGDSCDTDIFEDAVDSVLADREDSYRRSLSMISIRQKELLYAIAREGRAVKITSSNFIKRHKLLSASSVQSAIKILIERGLVVKEDDSYRVDDRFFGIWMSKLHGVDMVRESMESYGYHSKDTGMMEVELDGYAAERGW